MKNKIKLPEGYELEKLEKGRDYIHIDIDGDFLIINRPGDDNNFEFLKRDMRYSTPCAFREATKEEVVKFIERNLIIRYGKDWKNVKIEECMYHGETRDLNSSTFKPLIIKIDVGWVAWNKNGCLYNNGKWAKVLEETKYAGKLEDIDRPWSIASYGGGEVDKCYFSVQPKNRFTTKERAEQVLALIQLIAFRDDIWAKGGYGYYGIRSSFFGFEPHEGSHGLFSFKDKETCEYFIEKHRRLLEIYSGIFKK